MATFLIIGASSGIGKQLAEQLAASGHEVIGTFHTHPVQNTISNLVYHQLDVRNPEADFSFIPATLHGMVYCPGSIQLKPFARIKSEEFMEDYRLQVIGAIQVLQKAFPALKASGNGAVVLFSTVAVKVGLPFHSLVSSSKGAIEGLIKSLAAEWSPTIRVNAIALSLTDTPLAASLLSSDEKKEANAQKHPLKKIGSASDMANMAEFLLTDKSNWITGQIFSVDGGLSSLRV